jgi:hypothetical protein
VVIGLLGSLILLGLGAYKYLTRPGKLQVVVKPADTQISIDGTPLKGTPPMTIEKPPGPYHLAFEHEGYVRKDQNVEIQAGQFERLEIELEPSPDTGFELTSEPPGGLVWLDGAPFTSGDDNAQQARTNFKAYRVAPGKHTIEIKGDPRFDDFKLDFYQEPGKTAKLHAELRPRGGAGGQAPPPTPRSATPTPPPATAKAPTPPPAPPPAPKEEPKPAPRAAMSRQVVTPRPRPASHPVRTASATPAPTPPPAPRRPASDEDVFEKEDKLGAGKAAGGDCAVTLGSKPPSEVYIDGKKAGWTPLVEYKVGCGKHKVTFKNADIPIERTEPIIVKAGDKFKKVFSLVDTDQ